MSRTLSCLPPSVNPFMHWIAPFAASSVSNLHPSSNQGVFMNTTRKDKIFNHQEAVRHTVATTS